MAARRKPVRTWTTSQVVAHNLSRAREMRNLTQTEVAERLAVLTGSKWSATTVAQAEGSVSGQRVRQFTANELTALARTFDLPVLYFFLPPEDEQGAFETPDASPAGWSWEYLLLLVWGHMRNFPIVADRAAPWAHASAFLTVPAVDVLDADPDDWKDLEAKSKRTRLTPDDMLAVAFNGLARRRMRGSRKPGEDVQSLISNLRGLADALEAFNNYAPGTFFDGEEIRAVAEQRRADGEDDA